MKDKLFSLATKIENTKSKIKSEEATKQAMILPLLDILGYDIFDPEEVMPEIPCDISQAKGDKIDYVLAKNGKHQTLIECKCWQQNLNHHINQLKKYSDL